MERKRFIAMAGGVGAALASTPAGAARPRGIRGVRKHLEHVIDELQHDPHDYAGHRERALDLLEQARQELLAAERSVTTSR